MISIIVAVNKNLAIGFENKIAVLVAQRPETL